MAVGKSTSQKSGPDAPNTSVIDGDDAMNLSARLCGVAVVDSST